MKASVNFSSPPDFSPFQHSYRLLENNPPFRVPLRVLLRVDTSRVHGVLARRGIFEPVSARKRTRKREREREIEKETETGPHKFLDIGAVEIRSIEINSDAWHRREPVETRDYAREREHGRIARVGARRAKPSRAGPGRAGPSQSSSNRGEKKCNSKRSK